MSSHNFISSRSFSAIFAMAVIATFAFSARAQDAPAVHVGDKVITGIPDDWTHHHVVFSDPGTEQDAIKNGTHEQWLTTVNDPRYVIHQLKRDLPVRGPAAQDAETRRRIEGRNDRSRDGRDGWNDHDGRNHNGQGLGKDSSTVHRDWSMTLAGSPTTGAMGPGQYPAKYNFSTSSASCNDYVAYPTGLAGSSTQATIIAYNNLYGGTSGTCGSSATRPDIAWAYNTGGAAILSPVLSSAGDQVAYIQTVTGVANLVLLKWAPTAAGRSFTATLIAGTPNVTITGGTGTFTSADTGAQITGAGILAGDTILQVLSSTQATLVTAPSPGSGVTVTIVPETQATPLTPTLAGSAAAYQTCTAPCYYSIALSGNPVDTTSAPYYDFCSDAIYVGDGSDALHKFTSVFGGAPAEIIGGGSASGWPQTFAGVLSSPVYDSGTGNLFVGSSNGTLYRIPSGGGSANKVASGTLSGGGTGIVDSPVVDSTAKMVYVTANQDNSAQCNGGHPCPAGVFQLATNFAASSVGTEEAVGGSNAGVNVYSGTFDNIYYASARGTSPTGNLYVCGLSSGANVPTLYRIPITSNVLGAASGLAVASAAGGTCSPVTEFLNGATDWIFLSLTASGNKTGCTGPCVYNINDTSGTTPANSTPGITANGGTSGNSIDYSAGASSTTGESEVYYTTLGASSCVGNGTTGVGTHGCAVQASQSGLQ